MDDQRVASGVVGLVDVAGGCTLLLRRFASDRGYPSHWCFPGGRAEAGETTRDAASREAREETGLVVGQLEQVGRRESTSASGRLYVVDCYLTRSWSGAMITFPSAEHDAAAWVPFEALVSLQPMGETTHWLASVICSRFRVPR